jgi:L-aminoadipate-semialdehyde dehydrogenase
VKGCVQLKLVPEIGNTVNMVPVDHVATVIALSTITAPSSTIVLHIAARPPVTFNDIFAFLMAYGYDVSQCEYVIWRGKLEQHVLEVQDNALFPLLHFVLDDLPRSTRAPELDDANTRTLLAQYQTDVVKQTVDEEVTGRYLAWLINAGFLEKPSGTATKQLPILTGAAKAVGRSGQ